MTIGRKPANVQMPYIVHKRGPEQQQAVFRMSRKPSDVQRSAYAGPSSAAFRPVLLIQIHLALILDEQHHDSSFMTCVPSLILFDPASTLPETRSSVQDDAPHPGAFQPRRMYPWPYATFKKRSRARRFSEINPYSIVLRIA